MMQQLEESQNVLMANCHKDQGLVDTNRNRTLEVLTWLCCHDCDVMTHTSHPPALALISRCHPRLPCLFINISSLSAGPAYTCWPINSLSEPVPAGFVECQAVEFSGGLGWLEGVRVPPGLAPGYRCSRYKSHVVWGSHSHWGRIPSQTHWVHGAAPFTFRFLFTLTVNPRGCVLVWRV